MSPGQPDSSLADAADRPVVEDPDAGVAVEPPDSGVVIDPNAVRYARDVLPVLEQHCLECHHEGRMPSFEALPADVGAREVFADRIIQRAEIGTMPPAPRDRMTAAELDVVRAWKRDGLHP